MSPHRTSSPPALHRRGFLRLTGGLAAMGAAPWIAGCSDDGGSADGSASEGADGSPAGGGTLSLAFGTQPVIAYGLFFLGQESGAYETEGLDVELVNFDSGAPELEAMAGGSIAAGTMGATPALVANAQGLLDFKVVSVTDSPSEGYALLADQSIASVEDLAGRRVGCPSGSNYQYFLILALQKFGLSIDDVEYLDLEPLDAVAAFIGGELDAVVPPESNRFLIPEQREGTAELFTSPQFTEPPGPTDPFDLFDVIIASQAAIDDERDALLAFLRAFHGPIVGRLRDDPESTYQAVTDYLNTSGAGIEQDAVQNQFEVSTFYDVAEIQELLAGDRVVQSFEGQYQFLVDGGQIDQTGDAAALVDPSLVAEL